MLNVDISSRSFEQLLVFVTPSQLWQGWSDHVSNREGPQE